MIIVVRADFDENNKYYPRAFLDECQGRFQEKSTYSKYNKYNSGLAIKKCSEAAIKGCCKKWEELSFKFLEVIIIA